MRTLGTWLLLVASAWAEWLVAGPVPGHGRAAVNGDAVLAKTFGGAEPAWPKAGDAVGNVAWKPAAAPDEEGRVVFEAQVPAYAYTTVASDRDRVALADVGGASVFYLNGEPFPGNPYSMKSAAVPVALKKGDNHLLARCARGWVSLKLLDPAAPVFLNAEDATLPDLLDGVPQGSWGAILVVNATTETARGATLSYGKVTAPLPPLAPLSALKFPFLVGKGPSVKVAVTLGDRTHEVTLEMKSRARSESYVRTFRSAMDRSVQLYGVRAPAAIDPKRSYPLVLSLHGAGVEARGQASAYPERDGCIVVAPTNRRNFGFDWEEWGRLDALEALEDAQKRFKVDASRVYLTGHSMGGHGTWQLAALYPDLWAAAAPSAGWCSFYTYAGLKPDDSPAGRILRRGMATSDTLALKRNLKGVPLFLIHGDADDNVPIAQSELMLNELNDFHDDVRIHVQKGGKHWWDESPAPGADCLALPALFDFFQRRRRPDDPESWEFRTVSPAASSHCRGFEILAQREPGAESRVSVRRDATGALVVETANAVHVRVTRKAALTIDGSAFTGPIELYRAGDAWVKGAPAGLRKTPALQGPFLQAFHTPFLLVYGTAGSAEETRDALARARFDAAVWWYRGNGRALVVADADVTEKDRKRFNVILYGSPSSNSLWKGLADKLPIRAEPGRLTVGTTALDGDLAFAATYPDPENAGRLLALVGATGPGGRRAWLGLTIFSSGVGFADVVAWGADALEKGPGAVRLAGFFNEEWKPGEFWHVVK